MKKILVGISSCLLGEEVRYNGGHKLSRLCKMDLSRYFEYVSVCPEVAIGMGIPRTPIRLVGSMEHPRALEVDNPDSDFTAQIEDYANSRLGDFTRLSAYIFMKDSPSCGLFRVKLYNDEGNLQASNARGIFARIVTEHYPLLPVEEGTRLQDPVLRENFISRVFAYHDWQKLEAEGITADGLVRFHSRYKYTVMAHSPQSHAELGRMLADAGKQDPHELGQAYIQRLMDSLMQKANRKSHTNVLMHLQGYLKKKLESREKQKLAEVIDAYRRGIYPLIVPVTLLKHHFNNHPNDYISSQAYFDPYPEDLGLRNLI